MKNIEIVKDILSSKKLKKDITLSISEIFTIMKQQVRKN